MFFFWAPEVKRLILLYQEMLGHSNSEAIAKLSTEQIISKHPLSV